jgi:hypothetical protein
MDPVVEQKVRDLLGWEVERILTSQHPDALRGIPRVNHVRGHLETALRSARDAVRELIAQRQYARALGELKALPEMLERIERRELEKGESAERFCAVQWLTSMIGYVDLLREEAGQ